MAVAALSRHDDPETTEPRKLTINVRVSAQWRALIDRAANILGKTRTEFVLESARRSAEDVLLEQRLFLLDEKGYQAFVNLLDEPPVPSEQLRRLMSSKAPWET